ncbi:VOC family protein [Gluconacetobacter azotocaptans]|uniref:VOC family protein n=1 Tax=Gluconacetobacter azotocaptans TaxID=142834 RepID=A0A7W4JSW8_9PROT|nr:VOC family protein [Gluconacetobacter azotocaptans]MBB2190294.1 VOC family protein [Gluconacetobacter azotocaptans]MBM9400672.1 VOC family protein [Gluconacetobacter azotocaptans]GBQ27410.1 glyoxalase/bleomycin resistance protein [Gluconacetobacter azotocaptans DSM 13594]
MSKPFHLAFPVDDLDAARHFYGTVLGCPEGRSTDAWIDFDLFGNQIVTHHNPARASEEGNVSPVDGHNVPIPHFGVVLDMADWSALADRLKAQQVRFGMAPQVRFAGQPGEQATMFLYDPAGNALEFKAFADLDQLFRTT